ncbi:MAG: M23 family metallopeptidase, partial [Microcystaceae cyanobacterium]
AAESGVVAYIGTDDNYGHFVVINHDRGLQTRYAHLSRIQVQIGQSLKTGEVLGAVGVSGRPDLKVPHLHFEVRYKLPVGWVAQDPTIHLQKKFLSSP